MTFPLSFFFPQLVARYVEDFSKAEDDLRDARNKLRVLSNDRKRVASQLQQSRKDMQDLIGKIVAELPMV